MKKTGRPSSWGGVPTKAVRVPEALADQLLAIARRLQTESQVSETFVQKAPTLLTVEDKQGARRYLIPPEEPIDPTTEAEMDALIDQLFERYSQDDLLLMVAGMAEATLKPI
jgi:hypothetical protein